MDIWDNSAAVDSTNMASDIEKFVSSNVGEYDSPRCQTDASRPTTFPGTMDKPNCYIGSALDRHESTDTDHGNGSDTRWSSMGMEHPHVRHNLSSNISSMFRSQYHSLDDSSSGRQSGIGRMTRLSMEESENVESPPSVTSSSGTNARLTSLNQPMRSAFAIKSYHCRMCDQEFENKSDMQRHAKEVHRMEEKGHKCTKCFKSFPSSQQLVQHLLVHTNVRKYPCRFCDKAFKQLSHVQQHQRIHTGERPYRCTVDGCCKAFRQLSSLQQHLKGHNIPLPKSYPIAGHMSSSSAVIATNGSGNKLPASLARPHDLTCQVCEKQCADDVRFFRHIHKYHADYWRVFSSGRPLSDFIETRDVKRREKRYRCNICSKRYSHETGYIKHLAMHPESMPDVRTQLFNCNVCDKFFTKEAYLLRHMEMKLDERHCNGLEELKKKSPMFRINSYPRPCLPPTSEGRFRWPDDSATSQNGYCSQASPVNGSGRMAVQAQNTPSCRPFGTLGRSNSIEQQSSLCQDLSIEGDLANNLKHEQTEDDSGDKRSISRQMPSNVRSSMNQETLDSISSASDTSDSSERSSLPAFPYSQSSEPTNALSNLENGFQIVSHQQKLFPSAPHRLNPVHYPKSFSPDVECFRSSHSMYPHSTYIKSPHQNGSRSPVDQPQQHSPGEQIHPRCDPPFPPASPYFPSFQGLSNSTSVANGPGSTLGRNPLRHFVHPSIVSFPYGHTPLQDAYLRRNDISEHEVASALHHLARSVPGFR